MNNKAIIILILGAAILFYTHENEDSVLIQPESYSYFQFPALAAGTIGGIASFVYYASIPRVSENNYRRRPL